MRKKLIAVLAIVAAVIAYGQITAPPLPRVVAFGLRDIKTDAVWKNPVPEVFIGCPNMMHRVAMPNPTVQVENIWSDILEATRVEVDKGTFQREHGS